MKLLHISDLHIGKRVLEYSMLEDQSYILERILDLSQEISPDAMLIAGDIYDKPTPSAEAVTLFDSFLTRASQTVPNIFIIGGNHDSGERLAFASSLVKSRGVYISSVFTGTLERVRLYDEYGAVDIFQIPFIKPPMVRRFFEDEKIESYNDAVRCILEHTELDHDVRNVAVAHQLIYGAERSDSEESASLGGIEEIDASLFSRFDYTALGHLHRAQSVTKNVRYSGSPLKYSASEATYAKSVSIIELREKGDVEIYERELEPLRDMRVLRGSYDELMSRDAYSKGNTEDYIHITLTDESEIVNALARLRCVYPNIMSLKYDSLRFSEHEENERITPEASNTPSELFAALYKLQNGVEMTEEQKKTVEDICRELYLQGVFEA